MKKERIGWVIIVFVLLASCNQEPKEKTLFSLMENTGIKFRNEVEDGAKDNSFLFRNFYNGGGVAIDGVKLNSFAPGPSAGTQPL